MPSTVLINGRPAVHSRSGYVHVSPQDVCKTPGSGSVPYNNMLVSSDIVKGPKAVVLEQGMPMVDGAEFARSTLDEAGSGGGVVSGTVADIGEALLFSFDVCFEGAGAVREGDLLWHNQRNIFG